MKCKRNCLHPYAYPYSLHTSCFSRTVGVGKYVRSRYWWSQDSVGSIWSLFACTYSRPIHTHHYRTVDCKPGRFLVRPYLRRFTARNGSAQLRLLVVMHICNIIGRVGNKRPNNVHMYVVLVIEDEGSRNWIELIVCTERKERGRRQAWTSAVMVVTHQHGPSIIPPVVFPLPFLLNFYNTLGSYRDS